MIRKNRGQNARKTRKSYRFSKDWDVHNAATYFVCYSYNFCWSLRTLAIQNDDGSRSHRSPAMAAGLADHVWSLKQWLTFPARGGSNLGTPPIYAPDQICTLTARGDRDTIRRSRGGLFTVNRRAFREGMAWPW